MRRLANLSALLVISLCAAACNNAPTVEYDQMYSIASGETLRFEVNGEVVETSILNTGGADLGVRGHSADGTMNWQREHLQASALEPYVVNTTGKVTMEITNHGPNPGSFKIGTSGKGEIDFRQVQ